MPSVAGITAGCGAKTGRSLNDEAISLPTHFIGSKGLAGSRPPVCVIYCAFTAELWRLSPHNPHASQLLGPITHPPVHEGRADSSDRRHPPPWNRRDSPDVVPSAQVLALGEQPRRS